VEANPEEAPRLVFSFSGHMYLLLWFVGLFSIGFYLYSQRSSDGQVKSNPKFAADDGYEEEEDEHSETLCGSCGGNYNADEFWIGCDICERWYHGKCVKITPAKAESIKQYKCPQCSIRRNRP
jgi:ferredoxin